MNEDVNVLNGAFSIDEYVDVALEVLWTRYTFLLAREVSRKVHRLTQSFTITNVTLKSGTGYSVEFVNPSNHSNVYAIGPKFEVKPSGSEFNRSFDG